MGRDVMKQYDPARNLTVLLVDEVHRAGSDSTNVSLITSILPQFCWE